MKTVKTPEQLAEEAKQAVASKAKVTPETQPAIMNFARNDDLDVATLARQAHKQAKQSDDGEVIISLR